MKTKPILLFAFIAAQAAAMLVNTVQAATDPNDIYAVKVVATVSGATQITLSWNSDTAATGYEVRRKTTAATAWGAASTLSGSSTSFIDSTGLSAGGIYEYEVKKTFSGGDTGFGYASVSLGAAAVESRGKVILIVDNTIASSLASQLTAFTGDLVGDGWAVVRHDVARDDPNDRAALVAAVKAVIQAEYNADSTVKAVVLIGHIPVPYSGVFDISGHSASRGAYPADVYYGDVVGGNLWTDNIYGNTLPAWDQNNNSVNDRKDNFNGDGKFDQDRIPSTVELAVGRIDFSDLSGVGHAFTSSETDLLQQYFQKDHNYRHKVIALNKTALLADLKSFGYWPEWAPLATGWGRFSGLLNGSANIVFHDLTDNNNTYNFITDLASNEAYITQIAGTSGSSYNGIDNGTPSYTSAQFAANDIKTFFIAIGASYIPDWDSTDNFLRASLGSASYTLCAMTADNPSFTFHLLNTGATWGDVLRISQNNKGFPVEIASNQALPACAYSINGTTILLTANANGAISSTAIDSGATGANAYTLDVGDHVMIKNQATASQNGVYYVLDLGDGTKPWKLQRVAYADSNWELVNVFCLVSHGSSKSTLWNNTSASGTFDITVPSGSITFQSVANGVYHHRYWNDDPNAAIADGFPLNGLNHVHIALLGDPTLRLHVVDPVELSAPSVSSSTVTLNWTGSLDLTGTLDSGEGYYIYRGWGKSGPFKKLNSTPVQTTQYVDSNVPRGFHTYMVRACKLEGYRTGDMSTGKYYNLSQGVTATADVPLGTYWNLTVLNVSGAISATAAGINNGDNGQPPYDVAGEYMDSSSLTRAVRWNSGFSTVYPYTKTYAYGVNDSKVLTGMIDQWSPGYGITVRAFRWAPVAYPTATFTMLDPLPSGNNCSGTAINNAGTVVGYGQNQDGYYRAIRWQGGQNGADDLNTLLGDNFALQSYAYGVNRAGFIVGKSITSSGNYHAFLLSPNGKLDVSNQRIDLGTFTGGNNSEAYAINNLNEIAGSSQISGGAWRGFVRNSAGNLTQVNPPSGTDSVYLQGINDSGVAVGAYPTPLIWQEGMSSSRNLNDIKAGSPSFSIYGAEAINNQMAIVGWGYDGSGYTAFMLAPP